MASTEDNEHKFLENPGNSFDSLTMDQLLEAERSVLKAGQATMEAWNMMNINKISSQDSNLANTPAPLTSSSLPTPQYTCQPKDSNHENGVSSGHLLQQHSTQTHLNRRLNKSFSVSSPNLSIQIPRPDDSAHPVLRGSFTLDSIESHGHLQNASSSVSNGSSLHHGSSSTVQRKGISNHLFGLNNHSSSVVDENTTIYTFTVRKADNVLDKFGSKKASIQIQIDTETRMLIFLSPNEHHNKEEYSCAAVTAKVNAKLGLHLKIQKGSNNALLTKKIMFYSLEDRTRFVDALEQGKVMYKKSNNTLITHHNPSHVNNSQHTLNSTSNTNSTSELNYEDVDQWLANENSSSTIRHVNPQIDQLHMLEGEVIVEHIQRVTNLVIIAQKERAVQGIMKITNYRIHFMPYDTNWRFGSFDVPLAAVTSISRDGLKLNMVCKDLRKVCLAMHDAYTHKKEYDQPPQTPDVRWLNVLMSKMRSPLIMNTLYAYEYKISRNKTIYSHSMLNKKENGWLVYSPIVEYQRLGFMSPNANPSNGSSHSIPPSDAPIAWRLLKNSKFRFSPTYPQLMVVPSLMSEEQLVQSARFRSRGRLPIVVWRHPDNKCVLARSSQPNYGLQGNRCEADRILLRAYRDSANRNSGGGVPPLHIIDARKNLATQGNRLKGKGVENSSHYDNAVVEFLGIANIHKMRDSIEALQTLVSPNCIDDGNKGFHASLQETRWLKHIMRILSGSCRIAQILHDVGASVLVHCSDGWDRTPQLCAMAQLILDPYYRTIRGFAALIEKEWCSFGHKFQDRIGVGKDHADVPNERSPVMLQFLDCVYQMTRQFPTGFEFNETFLLHIVDSLTSGLYGTFLYNSERERIYDTIWEKTESVWTPVLENKAPYLNTNYVYANRVLFPRANLKRVVLWESLFFRWDPEMHPAWVDSMDPSSKDHNIHKNNVKNMSVNHNGMDMMKDIEMDQDNELSKYKTSSLSDCSSLSDEEEHVGENGESTKHVVNNTIYEKEESHKVKNMKLLNVEEYDNLSGQRAMQRTQARNIREALLLAPDKSRIKYLEQLLSESVARELQLEALLDSYHQDRLATMKN